jgi:hypothetical protein
MWSVFSFFQVSCVNLYSVSVLFCSIERFYLWSKPTVLFVNARWECAGSSGLPCDFSVSRLRRWDPGKLRSCSFHSQKILSRLDLVGFLRALVWALASLVERFLEESVVGRCSVHVLPEGRHLTSSKLVVTVYFPNLLHYTPITTKWYLGKSMTWINVSDLAKRGTWITATGLVTLHHDTASDISRWVECTFLVQVKIVVPHC